MDKPMEENQFVNEGGINGSGKGVVNTNSRDFERLREKISEVSAQRDPIDRMEDLLLGIRFRMQSLLRDENKVEPVSVGEFLEECIEVMKVKRKQFATYIGFEATNLSAVCKGKRKITSELALKLSKITHIPGELWLAVQNKEELAQLNQQKQQNFETMSLRDLLKKSA